MKHLNCGGTIEEDFSKLYDYEIEAHESYTGEIQYLKIAALLCNKCGVEILGDNEIEVDESTGQPIP